MAIEGLISVLNPGCFAVILVGVVVGIIFGSIPGLTSTMGVALCLPLTFSMSPLNGIAMLVALYVGGTSGGLISAILLKIPGPPPLWPPPLTVRRWRSGARAGRPLA